MAGPYPKTCEECGQVPTAVHDYDGDPRRCSWCGTIVPGRELPAPGVVQPGALDEPGVAQRYEAAGFDFEEVKRTARAAMDGDRGRLAAAAGASPDGRTEGSQASRENDPDFAVVCGHGFIDIFPLDGGDLVRISSRAEAVHLWVRLGEAILKQGWGPLIGGIKAPS